MKKAFYLSVTLLLSTVMYGMDDLEGIADSNSDTSEQRYVDLPPRSTEESEKTLIAPTKNFKKNDKSDAPIVTLKAVASTIIAASSTSEQKKSDTASKQTTDIENKTKKRGIVTNTKYWWYGAPTMVIDEIDKDKFDANIVENRHKLYAALTEKSQVCTPENLKQVHTILDKCRAKNIPVDDLAVINLVREFAHTTRTNEELALTQEATQKLTEAQEKRAKVIAYVNKIITQSIEDVTNIDNNLSKDLDAVYAKHAENISLGTEVKRLTRKVNQNIPMDGYDSDVNSKYDRGFNAEKLDLAKPTASSHKFNIRVAENLKKTKNLIEDIETKTFEATE